MKVKELTRSLACIALILAGISLFADASEAAVKSQPMKSDRRFRYYNYQPNTVYEYVGQLKIASRMDLDPTEKIITVSLGDPTGWVITPTGDNKIFIKPTEVGAITHMSIITDKRIYYFELDSKEIEKLDDSDVIFVTKFNYVDSGDGLTGGDQGFMEFSEEVKEANYVPDITKDRTGLNFNYTMSGDKDVAPIIAFDDGEFTYLRFKGITADMPAIFQVLPDGNEALINYRISKEGYVVIETVTSQFTLRFGEQIVCLFNENKPLQRTNKQKKVTKKARSSSLGIY